MHCSKGSGSTGGSGSGGLGVDATMSVADVMGMMPRLGSSDGMNSGGGGDVNANVNANANANANATESSSGGIVANAANDHDQENAMSQAISTREVIHAEQILKEHLARESRLALNNQSLPRTSSQGLDQNQNQGQGQNQGLRRSMDQSQIQGEGNTTAAMQQYFNKSQREQQQQQAQAQVETSMGMNMNMNMGMPLPLQRSNLGVEAGMMRQGPHNPVLNNHRHGHGHGPAHTDRDRNGQGQGQGYGGRHQQHQQQQQQQMQQDSNHYFTSIPSMNNTAPRFNPLSNRGLGNHSMNPGNNASNLSSFGHGSGMNMNMQVPSIPSSVLGGGGGDNSGSGGNLNIGRGRSSNQHRRIMEEAWNALSWESKMRAQDAGAGMGMSSRPSRYGFHPDLHY